MVSVLVFYIFIGLVLDETLSQMVERSVEADGGSSSYFEAPVFSSQGQSRFGSQSPVRFGIVDGSPNSSADVGFVPGTPESERKRLVLFYLKVGFNLYFSLRINY
jgi:hypothetical protein